MIEVDLFGRTGLPAEVALPLVALDNFAAIDRLSSTRRPEAPSPCLVLALRPGETIPLRLGGRSGVDRPLGANLFLPFLDLTRPCLRTLALADRFRDIRARAFRNGDLARDGRSLLPAEFQARRRQYPALRPGCPAARLDRLAAWPRSLSQVPRCTPGISSGPSLQTRAPPAYGAARG